MSECNCLMCEMRRQGIDRCETEADLRQRISALEAERDSLKAAIERWIGMTKEATEKRDSAYRLGLERAAEIFRAKMELNYYARHDHSYSGISISGWVDKAVRAIRAEAAKEPSHE